MAQRDCDYDYDFDFDFDFDCDYDYDYDERRPHTHSKGQRVENGDCALRLTAPVFDLFRRLSSLSFSPATALVALMCGAFGLTPSYLPRWPSTSPTQINLTDPINGVHATLTRLGGNPLGRNCQTSHARGISVESPTSKSNLSVDYSGALCARYELTSVSRSCLSIMPSSASCGFTTHSRERKLSSHCLKNSFTGRVL